MNKQKLSQFVVTFLILILAISNCQCQNIFTKSYLPGTFANSAYVADSNFLYLAGWDNNNDLRGIIAKIDQEGNKKWGVVMTRPCNNFYIRDMIQSKSGYLFVVGNVDDTLNLCPSNGSMCFIAKLDTANGQLIDSKIFGNQFNAQISKIIEDKDGNFIVAGKDNDFLSFDTACLGLLVKFDINMNIIWANAYSNSYGVRFWDLVEDSAGNIYTCGSFRNDTIFPNFFVSKMDSTGNIIWSKHFDDGYSTQAFDMILDGDKILISGSDWDEVNSTFYTGFISALDTSSKLLWFQRYIYPTALISAKIYHYKNKKYMANLGFVCIIDSFGNVVNTYAPYYISIDIGFDKNYSMYFAGGQGFALGKCDSNFTYCQNNLGNVTNTLITQITQANFNMVSNIYSPFYRGNISSTTTLLSDSNICNTNTFLQDELMLQKFDNILYPNPASDICRLTISNSFEHNKVVVYDYTGKNITGLVNTSFENNVLTIDASGLRAGFYLISVNYVQFKLIKK